MAGRYKPYSEYKDSGVEWLGLIPSHWRLARIKESAKVINGYPFDSKLFEPSQGIPLVRIRDISSSKTEVGYVGIVPPESLISDGDVLVGMDGDFNVAKWKGGEAALNQRVACIRAPNYRLQNFVFYALPFSMKIINDLTYYTTVKHLSSTDIVKTRFAFPPENELARIVDFLDHETAKIDTLIEKQQQLIQLLKEKRQAVISHAVTKGLASLNGRPNVKLRDSGVEWLGEVPEHWEISRLKYHTSLFEQGWSPQCDSRQAEDNEFGVLKVGCVNYGVFNSHENKALPKELAPQLQYLIREGDLLISRANTKELVGSAAVVDGTYENIILCDKLYRLRFDGLVEPQWMSYYLALPVVRQQIELGASGASHSMQNIGQSTIKELPIVIPSPEEVMAILSEIKNKIGIFELTLSRANEQITLLQERRAALISAAVTGKIDVRDWVAPQASQTNKEVAA